MKKNIVSLMLLLGLALPLLAQNKVEERVKLARERYAQGLETIATVKMYEEDDIPALNYTTVVRKENFAGSGMTVDKMEFYYNAIEDEMEPQPIGYKIMMVRRTYNVADTQYFEEYVYDEDCKPLFWFTRFGYHDETDYDYTVELRGYFDADGTLVRNICKKAGSDGKLKTCSIEDRVNESHEENFEYHFTQARKYFQNLRTIFDALYEMKYE